MEKVEKYSPMLSSKVRSYSEMQQAPNKVDTLLQSLLTYMHINMLWN